MTDLEQFIRECQDKLKEKPMEHPMPSAASIALTIFAGVLAVVLVLGGIALYMTEVIP